MARQLDELLRDFFATEELERLTGATADCLSLAVIADASAHGLSDSQAQHAAHCRHCLHALALAFRAECPSTALLAAVSAGRSLIAEAVRNHIEQDGCEACRSALKPQPRFRTRFIGLLSAAAILLAVSGALLMDSRRFPHTLTGDPVIATLMDGAGRVSLTQSGKLVPANGRVSSASVLTDVKDLLGNSYVVKDTNTQLALAAPQTGLVERGAAAEPAEDPVLLSPFATAIRSTRPAFSWQPVESASNYLLYVTDLNKKLVWKGSSGILTSLTLPALKPELVRGQIYLWQVEALVEGEPRLSHWAAFVVLGETGLQSVVAGEALYRDSPLFLGALYEKYGLYEDAEKEFHRLAQLNPSSPLPEKMLASLKQLRQNP